MHRESGGATFIEALAPQRLGRNAQLERMTALVEAQVRRPAHGAGAGARSERDRDASWTRTGGRSCFGSQGHLGADQGSGLVRRADTLLSRALA